MVTVRASSRIHIGLLDLGGASFRKYGGAGFCIEEPDVVVSAERSLASRVRHKANLDRDALTDIHSAVQRFQTLTREHHFEITVLRTPAQHVGFGTKTALILTVLKALDLLASTKLEPRTLQNLSRRGGTSGIGINTFFCGGFVTDLGHEYIEGDSLFKPSSASLPNEVPILGCRFEIPQSWRFHLILPAGNRLSSTAESAFFERTTPLPKDEVQTAITMTYHGVVPAVATSDLAMLSESLNVLHTVGFKARELAAQSHAVRQAYSLLKSAPDCAVGLSSLGPLLYLISEEDDGVARRAVRRASEKIGPLAYLGVVRGRNSGYEVVNG